MKDELKQIYKHVSIHLVDVWCGIHTCLYLNTETQQYTVELDLNLSVIVYSSVFGLISVSKLQSPM